MAIDEVVAAKRKLQEVLLLLRGAGIHDSADMLERSLGVMNGWYDTKEMLFVVGERCHPRALGDMVVKGLSMREWGEHVEELHDLCAKAFNVLERLPPEKRDEV